VPTDIDPFTASVELPDSGDPRSAFIAWLDEYWDPSSCLLSWRERLVDAGWATPSWPISHLGRDLPSWTDEMVKEELTKRGAVGLAPGAGTTLVAPTIREHAGDALRDALLRSTLTGAASWCQLFSEPGAGSDLAGLSARAVLDGDRWIVNGQKVWSTSADHADYGLLLARTDPDASKHRGITCFVLPLQQPGIEVRPIRQMNHHSSFNEIFLTNAEIPSGSVVGEMGGGWAVALSALHHERLFGGLGRPPIGNSSGRLFDEARQEAHEHMRTYQWYPQRQGRVDLLPSALRTAGLDRNPVFRQEIARVLSMQKVSEWTAQRAASLRAADRPTGAESSIGKLATSEIARSAAQLHGTIAGVAGLLTGESAPDGGLVAEILTSFPAQSIAGGTDQIQKNIVAEKVLGLPRA